MKYLSQIIELKLERGGIIGLLYILNNEKYLDYYKEGFIKFLPEFILPKIKPKIIDNIMREEEIIGKIAGINLKHIDFSDEYKLNEYLNAIIKLKGEDYTKLFIEGYDKLGKEIKDYIQEFTNMKILDGEETRINNLSSVIKHIYNLSQENLDEKEILVICDDKEKTKRIIKEISKDVRFVTAIGCEKYNDEIYEYILEETGLSLFYPTNIDRILENYSMIINFMDNLCIDFTRARRNSIVFDFRKENFFGNKKRTPFIEDFAFNLKDLGINENRFIENKISSNLFEAIIDDRKEEIKYLYSEGKYYSIEDYVNLFVKVKGKF